MFASFWIDEHLNFGNPTTNRVESQHAILKKHLGSEKASLHKFIGCIDQIVKSQLTAIKESFETSRINHKHEHNLSCFELLCGAVSLKALDIISQEVNRLNYLRVDLSDYGCKLPKSCGLPCACVLSVYLNTGQCIPLDSIDFLWRKLDFSPSKYEQNDDICCDDELESFKQSFNKQSKFGKRSWLRKLKQSFNKQSRFGKRSWLRKLSDIFDSSKTIIKEPAILKHTRGRPSLKKQCEKNCVDPKKQDPHRYNYSTTPNLVKLDLDLNKALARHSSYSSSQTRYSHELMTQIPEIFHRYITHIENVKSDGNCGYRALAVCLGLNQHNYFEYIRQQMKEELQNRFDIYTMMFQIDTNLLYDSLCFIGSPCPIEYRMIMPAAGVLIANKLDVIVHFLSKSGSSTIFPFWKGPKECQHHQTHTIALVNANHYVMVQLEGEYTISVITPYWSSRYISSSAAEWETMYRPHLELFTRLCRRERVFDDISD